MCVAVCVMLCLGLMVWDCQTAGVVYGDGCDVCKVPQSLRVCSCVCCSVSAFMVCDCHPASVVFGDGCDVCRVLQSLDVFSSVWCSVWASWCGIAILPV